MSKQRRAELVLTRNRLNNMGDYYRGIIIDEEADLAIDTIPRQGSNWNKQRIRVRNKINQRLHNEEEN